MNRKQRAEARERADEEALRAKYPPCGSDQIEYQTYRGYEKLTVLPEKDSSP